MKTNILFLNYLIILLLSSNIFANTVPADTLLSINSIQRMKIFKIEDTRVARSTYLQKVSDDISDIIGQRINDTNQALLSQDEYKQHRDRILLNIFIQNELKKISDSKSNIKAITDELKNQNLKSYNISEHPRYLDSLKAYLSEESLSFNIYASEKYKDLIRNLFNAQDSKSPPDCSEIFYYEDLQKEASKNIINKLKNLFQYYWFSERFKA